MRDTWIERTMLACIIVASAIIVCDTVRCFGPLQNRWSMALSIRAGMVFLAVSCAICFAITAVGWFSLAAFPQVRNAQGS